jgi:pyridoxal phosphate-dependent aminotransferase EpsN
MQKRILLSVPHLGDLEQQFVLDAFNQNWISTVGPNITAFESEFEARMGRPAVALSSGTAAIHLGLRLLDVGPGDEVICPTLTFVATANPVTYLGAKPVFVDSAYSSWNIDAELLADELENRARKKCLPKAVIVVHLYGQPCDMDQILTACNRFGVPVLEDAAEALGSLYQGKPVGTLSEVGTFSFNGNKIITTSGGGMLVTRRPELAAKARFWATQARDAALWYEHSELGYNYRMSNILAGIGRGQLRLLDLRVQQRRAVAFRYRDAFLDVPGISMMPQAQYGLHNNWLSCFVVDENFGCSRDELIALLDAANIESRPVWKPMHLQPLYSHYETIGGSVAADLFQRGVCLPSSSSLTADDQMYVINHVRRAAGIPALKELKTHATS